MLSKPKLLVCILLAFGAGYYACGYFRDKAIAEAGNGNGGSGSNTKEPIQPSAGKTK